MIINADLHIHSPFSGGTSHKIDLNNIAVGAKKKGLQLVATGDCLHPSWQREIGKYEKDGIISIDGIHFVLSVEVEDRNRVHHLLFFPDFYAVNSFKSLIEKYSSNIRVDGRPKVMRNGAEILDYANDANAIIGPAHAFTPWTSLYAYFNSLTDYYGKKPDFVELGLSADSNYADRIKELHDIPFLTNSDAHSYGPARLGREFNRMNIDEFTWESVKKAILHGGITQNVGFPPSKGKYNRTACSSCFRHYEKKQAETMNWRCYCNGLIKKGVKDRVDELATFKEAQHPSFRPSYIHLIPLIEIILEALHYSVF